MIYFDSKNLTYEISTISESREGNTILFDITKKVFADSEHNTIVSYRNIHKRLKVDDEDNVYTTRNGNIKWFNWHTKEVFTHFSIW